MEAVYDGHIALDGPEPPKFTPRQFGLRQSSKLVQDQTAKANLRYLKPFGGSQQITTSLGIEIHEDGPIIDKQKHKVIPSSPNESIAQPCHESEIIEGLQIKRTDNKQQSIFSALPNHDNFSHCFKIKQNTPKDVPTQQYQTHPCRSKFSFTSSPKPTQEAKSIQSLVEGFNSKQIQVTTPKYLTPEGEEVGKRMDSSPSFVDKGTYGAVFKIKEKPSMLVKMIETQVNPNEILVPISLKCENIVAIHALIVHVSEPSAYQFWIFQQNCGLSLKALIRDSEFKTYIKDPAQYNFAHFLEGMFNGVSFLENLRVCHCDLKMENVCASQEKGVYTPRLIDFGSCQTSQDRPKMNGVSPEFLPPGVIKFMLSSLQNEVSADKQGSLLIDEKSDSWSVAIIGLCLLREGQHPVEGVPLTVTRDGTRGQSMLRIAALTEDDLNAMIPPCLPEPVSMVFKGILRIDRARWGASQSQIALKKFLSPKLSTEWNVNLKQSRKRPVSPYKPEESKKKEEDMANLVNFFLKLDNKSSQDNHTIFKSKKVSQDLTKVFQSSYQPLMKVASPDPFILRNNSSTKFSTLKYKPAQNDQGGLLPPPTPLNRLRQKEVLYDTDSGASSSCHNDQQNHVNIPNLIEFGASPTQMLNGLGVRCSSMNVVQAEDDGNEEMHSPPPILQTNKVIVFPPAFKQRHQMQVPSGHQDLFNIRPRMGDRGRQRVLEPEHGQVMVQGSTSEFGAPGPQPMSVDSVSMGMPDFQFLGVETDLTKDVSSDASSKHKSMRRRAGSRLRK